MESDPTVSVAEIPTNLPMNVRQKYNIEDHASQGKSKADIASRLKAIRRGDKVEEDDGIDRAVPLWANFLMYGLGIATVAFCAKVASKMGPRIWGILKTYFNKPPALKIASDAPSDI